MSKGHKQPCKKCGRPNSPYQYDADRNCKDKAGCESRITKRLTFRGKTMNDRRKGGVAVEMAICMPLLCFFLLAAIDLWRANVNHSAVISQADAGARYGSIDSKHAANTSGITAAALANGVTDNTPTITITTTTKGDDTYITVVSTVPFEWFTPVPNMPATLSASRTYIVQP